MRWLRLLRLRHVRKQIAMMQVGIDESEIMLSRLVTDKAGYGQHLAQHILSLRISQGHLKLKEKELDN